MKHLILIIVFTEISFTQVHIQFIKGADLSFIPQIEDLGGKYYMDGMQTDPLEIFKQNDLNYIRLRLWHTPTDGYCGLDKTLQMAARIKQKGFKLLLDFHYSDTWADPTNQKKPAAWDTLSYNLLIDSIYYYSYNVIKSFAVKGILPDMVQIGNEISGGFLWDTGKVSGGYNTPGQWEKFTSLLKSAVQGVKDAAPDSAVPVMLHIDRGGDNGGSRFFFDQMVSAGVPFDIIGESFYPWWQGTLEQLQQNINDIAATYGKDIIVVETAYPWTLINADTVKNFVDSTTELDPRFPADVEGQDSFLTMMMEIISNVPGNKGRGIFYWAPEYISVAPLFSSWDNLTLFNSNGEVLNSIKVFNNPGTDTIHAINATVNLNTSAHPDTLSAGGYVQLRGEAVNGSDTLAGGEIISWDENSGIVFKNINGDYWSAAVKVLPGTELHYKYWTGHDSITPTFLRSGWEGPVTPYDSYSGDFRKFIAGNRDTLLSTEYYNPSGDTVDQYWQPFVHKPDSIAVRFKVNMAGAESIGRFDPEINGPVGVRGDPLDSINILSWNETKIILSRDSLSVNNGSFWSGTAYYPLFSAGLVQPYKFYIENDTGNGLESSITERTFTISSRDTTIYWVYFDNQNISTDVQSRILPIDDFILYQNYPNPFNPSTKITFELMHRSRINIAVFNYLGEKTATLADKDAGAGIHTIEWEGKDSFGNNVSSGIYFIRLTAWSKMKVIKALLLK